MIRLNKRWLLQLAAVYYIALFLFLRHFYNGIEEESAVTNDNKNVKDISMKVDELSKLSNGLTRNLMNLHDKLSETLRQNVSSTDVEQMLQNNTKKLEIDLHVSSDLKQDEHINATLEKEFFENVSKLTEGAIKPENMIVHISPNGDVEINKTVLLKHLRNSLRKWDYENESMAFMHIGKNGGTSFRGGLTKAQQDNGCRLKSVGSVSKQEKHPCPGIVPCVCNRHYDWTVIDDLESRGVKVTTVALLRHPVKRATSHFYFAQTLPWTKQAAIRKQSLSQYLADPHSMLDTRDVWQDGQAAVSWFSATHIASWVVKLTEAQKQNREAMSLDWNYLLNRALINYHRSLWVGVMEKMDQSLELLHYQSGLNVKMSHSNKNKRKGADPTEGDKIKLARLMPLDMWFYNYSSQVHDAKWKLYQLTKSSNVSQVEFDKTLNGLADDMITNLPNVISGCRSTRFILSCPEEKFYFQMNMTDARVNSQQRAMLPKTFS